MPAPPAHPPQPLVRGGSQTVSTVQHAALIHLMRDEIDDSINLVEGIVFAYYSYFERSLDFREKNPTSETGFGTIDFKPYIGMALHNLGVLNLLKGDYDEALSYFSRAVENRKGNLGEDHPHYIVSSKGFMFYDNFRW
jgi:tetratricopeptide (TPR) repeat protein